MIDAKAFATLPIGTEYAVLGVWIPRKGDNVRLPVEVVCNYYTDLSVELYEKNYDEVGDGASTGAGVAFNGTTGRQVLEYLGSKELLRVRLVLLASDGLPEHDVGLILLRFLQPVWFEAVEV